MSCITCIKRLHKCGIFKDFTWPSDLPKFGRYNLIYGWNWTGKTTLSRILRCMEKRTAPMGEITVEVDGKDIRYSDFTNITVPIRVFNREFIEESVFPFGEGDLPPIFVLGVESVEKQKEVERLKGAYAEAQSKLELARSTKEGAEKNFEQFCIDRARVIKETLRSSGQNRYNNYNKADFKDDAEKMAKAGDAEAHRLSEDEHDGLIAQHHSTLKPNVKEVTYCLPDFAAIRGKLSELLTTTVVSAAIESLKTDPSLSTWTREGLKLHRDRRAERCLFCEQPLPSNRLQALEAHFSAQYEQFMQNVDQYINRIQEESKKATELRLPNKAELYDNIATEFEVAETGLCDAMKATCRFLDAAVVALEDKKQRAFERVDMTLQEPQADADAVEKLNAVIRKHNQAYDEFQTRVDKARERLAHHMIAEALEEFVRLREAMQQKTNQVQETDKKVEQLQAEINKLEREIVEHRRPAEELNEELHKYLGHDELRLEIKENGYKITRAGMPAQALSEGEMTAIALLYFLKSLNDRQFDLKNGVVVFDDPVSSLDANALYLAFGFIRDRTEEAGQLIILTHNFTFFRQVRNWFHHLKGQNKKDINQRPARFYMLECAHDQNGRCAGVRLLDPLLEQYESEYHYLFACVYRASNEKKPADLEKNYCLPNMARRLLEAFLAFRQPKASGELWQQMQGIAFDAAKKQRILRFLHTYSHNAGFGEPEHDPSLLAEAGEVLKDILELIKTQDKDHFDAMETLVNQQITNEDDE